MPEGLISLSDSLAEVTRRRAVRNARMALIPLKSPRKVRSPIKYQRRRQHLITHPIFGVTSFNELKTKVPDMHCRWCCSKITKLRRKPYSRYPYCDTEICRKMIQRAASLKSVSWEALDRDNRTCQICGLPDCWEVDHRIPVCIGGTGDIWNLRTLCYSCHLEETRRIPRDKFYFIPTPDKLVLDVTSYFMAS